MDQMEEGSSRKYKKREQIKLDYVNILTPKNMRSVYWQYFGYPTDENYQIITKDNVVCTLCHLVMRNHNNTTNLRAHMQSTHKDLLKRICKENDIVVPPRKQPPKSRNLLKQYGERSDAKRNKLKLFKDGIKTETGYSSNIFVNALTYDTETIDKKTEEDFSNSEYVQMDYEDMGISSEPSHDISNCSSYVIGSPKILSTKKMIHLVSSMLIKDLKDTSMILDNGFVALIAGISNEVKVPTIEEVETFVDTRYTVSYGKCFNEIKKHSELYSFSISFEIWEDITNKQFISIYVNYISHECKTFLKNILLNTVILNKYTSFEETLTNVNLNNCVAAITNKKHLELELFLSQNDIPLIQSFLSVRDNCLERIFELDFVSCTFNQVLDVIRQHAVELQDTSIPNIIPHFPWSKFYLMKFFCENISWPDEFNVLLSDVKSIIFILNSLETTMETLIEEDTPFSSIIKPLVIKLLEKYFQADSSDDSLISELKNVIKIELKQSILSNQTLTISALLDPRFQRYLQNDSIDSILSILNKKLKVDDEERDPNEQINNNLISKRQSLKQFFEGDFATTNSITQENDRVDNDVIKYRSNAHADFDQSPLVWWNKFGFMYTTLRKLSDKYNCIPFCINLNYKKPYKQQIDFHKRRTLLPDKLKNQLLFLNYNTENL